MTDRQCATEAEDSIEPSIDRQAMLTPKEFAEFTAREPWRGIAIIGIDMLLMLVCIVLCEAYWSPLAYAVTVMFTGARQIGLGTIALHDGLHGLLLRNRRHNDLLARGLCWVLLLPVIYDFYEFRRVHLQHHRHTNGQDDPDLPVFMQLFGAPRSKLVLILLLLLSGIRFFATYVPQYWRRSSWPHRIIASSVTAGVLAGAWMSVYSCRIFLLYWLLPLATWGMFINAVRFITEHYPAGLYGRGSAAAGVILTREILPTWFDLLFVATRGINYHFTHHLFPSVPFSKLRQLQRRIARTSAYQGVAHVTHGYHHALLEVFTKELAAQPAAVMR
jgi:fatty acid desaturase